MNIAFQDIEAPRAAAAYRDSRADGGHRDVTLTPECVTISRRVAGMRMRIAVPTRVYRGIVLTLTETASGRLCHKVVLRHSDIELDVDLTETFDENEALVMWRGWGRYLGQPIFIERAGGELERYVDPQAVAAPAPIPRRAGAQTRRSRGRFARRRRTGAIDPLAPVLRDHREIISYE